MQLDVFIERHFRNLLFANAFSKTHRFSVDDGRARLVSELAGVAVELLQQGAAAAEGHVVLGPILRIRFGSN
jgi:hypothetical protein